MVKKSMLHMSSFSLKTLSEMGGFASTQADILYHPELVDDPHKI